MLSVTNQRAGTEKVRISLSQKEPDVTTGGNAQHKALGVTSWEVQIPRQDAFDRLSLSPGMKTAPGWGTAVCPTGAGLGLDLTGF